MTKTKFKGVKEHCYSKNPKGILKNENTKWYPIFKSKYATVGSLFVRHDRKIFLSIIILRQSIESLKGSLAIQAQGQ